MTTGGSSDDEASFAEEDAAYWRHRGRTSWALGWLAAALLVLLVFHEPRNWGDGQAAAALVHGAQVVLAIAAIVAHVSNGRMAERRGFIRGRFRQAPSREPPGRGPAR